MCVCIKIYVSQLFETAAIFALKFHRFQVEHFPEYTTEVKHSLTIANQQ